MTSGHRGKVRWGAEAHTLAGKHAILRHYLGAWFPILAKYHNIVYIDGFAGPGSYAGGEEGSPLIALRELLDHKQFSQFSKSRQFRFVFIEKEPQRSEALEAQLTVFGTTVNWHENVRYEVVTGEFAVVIEGVLGKLANDGFGQAPRFTFVDPFGYKGTPMRLIKRLVETQRSEVLIFLPYPSIKRFAPHSTQQDYFDDLYATMDWRRPAREPDPNRRREGMIELYQRQLKAETGLAHIWKFELIDKLRNHYFLIFGTNSEYGLSKMKVAGWSVDKVSGSAYKAPEFEGKQYLFEAVADLAQLRDQLLQRFQGTGWVSIGKVERFVLLDTVFSEELHLREKTLKPMEYSDPPLIEVQKGSRKKRGTYPPGTILRFL